jgi:MFS family permease
MGMTPRTMSMGMTARTMSRDAAFWSLAVLLSFVLAASAVLTPLYVVYQQEWGFSAVTLTSVFAVYALTLLVTLLCIGSTSDRVGRRQVLAVGLVLEIGAMALFLDASSVGWVFAGRGLQGVATALVMGTTTAALIDLEPEGRPIAPLVNACAPMVGLAVGAGCAGALVEWAPLPTHLVFWLLVGVFVAGLGLLAFIPETVPRTGRWLEQLLPQIGLPDGTHRAFVAALPGLTATWALGGLYFSLGPSLATTVLGNSGHLAGGLVITALAGTASLAAIAVRNWEAERMMLTGLWAFAFGVSLTVLSLIVTSTPLFFTGTVLAGVGFGPGFLGAFRSLTALAPADRRAELVSSIYSAAYLAFSLPAIAAGAAVTQVGLRTTADVYGAVAVLLALSAALATTKARPPDPHPAG